MKKRIKKSAGRPNICRLLYRLRPRAQHCDVIVCDRASHRSPVSAQSVSQITWTNSAPGRSWRTHSTAEMLQQLLPHPARLPWRRRRRSSRVYCRALVCRPL